METGQEEKKAQIYTKMVSEQNFKMAINFYGIRVGYCDDAYLYQIRKSNTDNVISR